MCPTLNDIEIACEVKPFLLISHSLSGSYSIQAMSRTKDFELVAEILNHVNNGITIIRAMRLIGVSILITVPFERR